MDEQRPSGASQSETSSDRSVGPRADRRGPVLVAMVAVVALAWVVLDYLGPRRYPPVHRGDLAPSASGAGGLEATGLLAAVSDDAGFERAEGPRELVFPRDHGPHDEFENEWWYLTGNLTSTGAASGREFGFQLTFFRRAAYPPRTPSQGAPPADRPVPQIYLAHFALSDIAGGDFHGFERLGRADLGTAEARASPFEVAVGSWSMRAPQRPGPDGAAEQAERLSHLVVSAGATLRDGQGHASG